MKMQETSSRGSIQKRVDAAPPHANSPTEPKAAFAAGSTSTENQSPNPIPSMAVSVKVDWPRSLSVAPPGK